MQKKTHTIYEIKVEGSLGNIWLEWFSDLKLRQEISVESGLPVTVIYGEIADPPALYGLLAKIRDLNLTLISVQKVEEKGDIYHENK